MTEREKRENVIRAMELCTSKIETRTRVPCEICPYHNKKYHGVLGNGCCNARSLQGDVLTILKAQEPVMVEERADTNTINCPKCGQQFARVGRDKSIYLDTDEEPNYCPKCGQAVKWE